MRLYLVLAFVLALVGETAGLDLTGGPSESPPGGGGCTSNGGLGQAGGLTLYCTVTSPGNFVDLYFGLVNDTSLNGMAMDGTGPSGFETFRYSSKTATSIVYTSSSPVGKIDTTEGATTRLVLTLLSGDGVVLATDGEPADNANGDIGQLFRISSSSFSMHVDLQSNSLTSPVFSPANSGLYDSAQTPANTRSLASLDFGFYYNECSP
jgi:hypothetical protein